MLPTLQLRLRRVVAGLGPRALRHGHLAVIVGAALVLTQTVRFDAPEKVRVGPPDAERLVHDVAPESFSPTLDNPHSTQIRATLRLYPEHTLPVGDPNPKIDRLGRVLAQPVMTTLFGMNASIEQDVQLEGGALRVHVELHTTPTLLKQGRVGQPTLIELETQLRVESLRKPWFGSAQERVHVFEHARFVETDEHPHRVVFAVDDHLFSLDIELHHELDRRSPA